MSAAILLLDRLCQAGGGPIRASRVDAGLGIGTRAAVRVLLRDGLALRANSRELEVTPLGWQVHRREARLMRAGRGPWRVMPVVRAGVVPDGFIESLLLDAGHEPGAALRPDTLRQYTARVWAMAQDAAGARVVAC